VNTQTQAHKTAHVQQQPGREEEAQKDRDSMYNSRSRSRERVTMQRMRMNNLSSSETWGRGGRQERESESEGGSGVVGGNRILLTGFGQPVSVLEVWACEQCMFLRVRLRACLRVNLRLRVHVRARRLQCVQTLISYSADMCVQILTSYSADPCAYNLLHMCVCARAFVCVVMCACVCGCGCARMYAATMATSEGRSTNFCSSRWVGNRLSILVPNFDMGWLRLVG